MLSKLEKDLLESVAQGKPFTCGPGRPPSASPDRLIRADVLRAALLGVPAEDGAPALSGAALVAPIAISGAWITGRLDLENGRRTDGGMLPAISLTHCVFENDLVLDNARLASLSLKESRFPKLEARFARIGGALDLSCVASSEQQPNCTGPLRDGVTQGVCWVELEGAHIEGDLRICNSVLCAPAKQSGQDFSGGGRPYALHGTGARIDGSVVLQPGFRAIGGVRLANSVIGGTVWMQGAHLCAEWGVALNISEAQIAGSVAMSALFRDGQTPQPFRADGELSLYGANISGELYMAGAKLSPRKEDTYAINAFMATIGKHVRLTIGTDDSGLASSIPFEALGQLSFQSATIGTFWAQGAIIGAGDTQNAIDLEGAHIRGDLQISSIMGTQVTAQGEGQPVTANVQHRAVVRGVLHAKGLRVSGEMRIEDAQFQNVSVSFAIFAPGMQIERDLRITGTQLVDAGIQLANANVGGDLLLHGTDAGNRTIALEASGLRVEHSIHITRGKMRGALQLGSIRVSEHLELIDLEIQTPPPRNSVELAYAVIDGSLQLRSLTCESGISMSFSRVLGTANLSSIEIAQGGLNASGAQVDGPLSIDISANGLVGFDQARVRGETTLRRARITASGSLSLRGANLEGGLQLPVAALPAIQVNPTFDAARIRDMRRLPLPFYPGWSVVEILYNRDAEYGAASVLWDGKQEIVILDGRVDPIHAFNKRQKLKLGKGVAYAYLEFFCNHLWGEEGCFRLVRDPQDLAARQLDPANLLEWMKGDVIRIKDGWKAKGIVDYGGALFATEFEMTDNGQVQMIGDNQLTAALPPEQRALRFQAPFRLGARPIDPLAIRALQFLDDTAPWPEHTVMHGPWSDQSGANAAGAIAALYRTDPKTRDLIVRRVRSQALSFYAGWTLIQGLIETPSGLAVTEWLWDDSERTVRLDGGDNDHRAFNKNNPPALGDIETIKSYLRFFTAHLWADQGAFPIVESPEDLPFTMAGREKLGGLVRPLHVTSEAGVIEANGTVVFGGHLFEATFRIQPTGHVEILNDSPLGEATGETVLRYDKPFVRHVTQPPYKAGPVPEIAWPTPPILSAPTFKLSHLPADALNLPFEMLTRNTRIPVRLSGSRAASLEDRNGKAWGENVRLDLAGFTYDHIDTASTAGLGQNPFADSVVETERRGKLRRKHWLKLQYGGSSPKSESEFDTQPHAQLAEAYKRAGRNEDARIINRDRLVVEGHVASMDWIRGFQKRPRVLVASVLGIILLLALGLTGMWPAGTLAAVALVMLAAITVFGPLIWHHVYDVLFAHGLYTRNAVATFLAFLLVGWVGVEIANRNSLFGIVKFETLPQVLVQDISTVQNVLIRTGDANKPFSTGFLTVDSAAGIPGDLPCATNIQSFLYATDIFIPLIDLRQETRCSPRADAEAWQFAKALYAILGWIVTSLTVLTVSGVLRQRSEGT